MPFYESKNDHSNFCISFTANPRYDFGIFAKGYRYSADILANKLSRDAHYPDYEAYPVVFLLYRHAFELHLKNIIYQMAMILAFKRLDDIDSSLYNRHNLIELSQKAQKVLQKAFPTDRSLQDVMDQVIETANEFSEIDPDSYSYRYPIDKTGKASTKHHQVVNLNSFAIHMSELLEKLEVIDFGLDAEKYVSQEVYEWFETMWPS